MDYTETYRKIYKIVKTDHIPHELAHNSALAITNAMSGLFLFTQDKPEAVDKIADVLQGFIKTLSTENN